MDALVNIMTDDSSPEAYAAARDWPGWKALRDAMLARGTHKCFCEDGKWTHFSDGVARDCLICGGTGKIGEKG